MTAPSDIVAIIPARGGSKGIPRKNVRMLAGRPLVAHSISHALATPAIAKTFVSTDDAEIADVSYHWGAEVIRRPRELAGDLASSESALLHALNSVCRRGARDPDLVVFLQATSPIRRPDDIQQAIHTLCSADADSLLSVGPVHGFVWRVQPDGSPASFTYDYRNRQRRQDAPEDLLENGSIYVFKPWVLRKLANRLGGRIALHRMSLLDSFQIDSPEDFDFFELLFRMRATGRLGDAHGPDPSRLRAVRLLVLDFDGVMTDNRVMVLQDGSEGVLCHRGDGFGIAQLRAHGVEVAVISKEVNAVVTARCTKLNIYCVQSCDAKLAALQALAEARQLLRSQIAYVGNDLNDLECLGWAGLPIAVADAAPEVLAMAHWTTRRPGGRGAVREICDLLSQSLCPVGA